LAIFLYLHSTNGKASSEMKIKLLLFSSAADLAGFREREIERDDLKVAGSILAYLTSLNTEFDKWAPYLRVAVNSSYVEANHQLSDGDEVAVIPPVSGG